MEVVIVFPSTYARRSELIRTLIKSGAKQVTFEGPCLVCKVRDSEKLASLSGVDRIAGAKKISRRFSDVTAAIIKAGTDAIVSGEKFHVKAVLASKCDYVARDIEFAASGALVEKLAKIHALPARNELEADRILLAIVGKKSAYICVRGSP